MNNEKDCYPGLERRFESCDEELRAVRGLRSSSDLKVEAEKADFKVKCARDYLDVLREHGAAYLNIAADQSIPTEIRAEAASRAADYAGSELAHEIELRCKEEFATQLHQDAAQALRFEKRWSFNPYTDPLLDRIERQQKLESAQATPKSSRRRRK